MTTTRWKVRVDGEKVITNGPITGKDSSSKGRSPEAPGTRRKKLAGVEVIPQIGQALARASGREAREPNPLWQAVKKQASWWGRQVWGPPLPVVLSLFSNDSIFGIPTESASLGYAVIGSLDGLMQKTLRGTALQGR